MHQKLSRSFDRHRFFLFIFATVVLGSVLSASNASAKYYYVAKSGVASDNNEGTIARPLRSIARAVERAKPGDTVVVRAGDYRNEDTGWGRGVIPVLAQGEPGKAIRIYAPRGDKVLVHTFLLQKAKYVMVSGFNFKYCDFASYPNWQDMPCIVRDIPENPDAPIDYTQDWSQRRSLVEPAFATYFSLIKRLEYVNAINLEDCSNITLVNNVIDGYWAGIQCRHCERVSIAFNTISHTVNGIFAFDPSPALVNSTIHQNNISHSLDIGISLRRGCNRVVVYQNEVEFSGTNHISVMENNLNCTVLNNRLSNGGYYSEAMQYPGSSGISIHSSLSGNNVIGNDIAFQIDRTNIDGNGIIVDLMEQGSRVVVTGNFVYRNQGSGLNLTISPNARIIQNVFVENGYCSTAYRSGAGIKLSRGEDVGNFIYANYFVANKDAGILSEHTLLHQQYVNYNVYFSIGKVPIAWDSYYRGYRVFNTVKELNQATGWEARGYEISSDH